MLGGVKDCCRESGDRKGALAWEERGRKYKLERCSKEAGRFLLCSVRALELKRFCIIVPEGKGLLGGWNTLAEKLRGLGVEPYGGAKPPITPEAQQREKGWSQGPFLRLQSQNPKGQVIQCGWKWGQERRREGWNS